MHEPCEDEEVQQTVSLTNIGEESASKARRRRRHRSNRRLSTAERDESCGPNKEQHEESRRARKAKEAAEENKRKLNIQTMEMDVIRADILKRCKVAEEKEITIPKMYIPKEIIPKNIKQEIERQHKETERRRRDHERRMRLEEAKEAKMDKKNKKAEKRKNANTTQRVNEDENTSGEISSDMSNTSLTSSSATSNSSASASYTDCTDGNQGYLEKHLQAYHELMKFQPKRHTNQQLQEERKRLQEASLNRQQEELTRLRTQNDTNLPQQTQVSDMDRKALLEKLREKERLRNMEEDMEDDDVQIKRVKNAAKQPSAARRLMQRKAGSRGVIAKPRAFLKQSSARNSPDIDTEERSVESSPSISQHGNIRAEGQSKPWVSSIWDIPSTNRFSPLIPKCDSSPSKLDLMNDQEDFHSLTPSKSDLLAKQDEHHSKPSKSDLWDEQQKEEEERMDEEPLENDLPSLHPPLVDGASFRPEKTAQVYRPKYVEMPSRRLTSPVHHSTPFQPRPMSYSDCLKIRPTKEERPSRNRLFVSAGGTSSYQSTYSSTSNTSQAVVEPAPTMAEWIEVRRSRSRSKSQTGQSMNTSNSSANSRSENSFDNSQRCVTPNHPNDVGLNKRDLLRGNTNNLSNSKKANSTDKTTTLVQMDSSERKGSRNTSRASTPDCWESLVQDEEPAVTLADTSVKSQESRRSSSENSKVTSEWSTSGAKYVIPMKREGQNSSRNSPVNINSNVTSHGSQGGGTSFSVSDVSKSIREGNSQYTSDHQSSMLNETSNNASSVNCMGSSNAGLNSFVPEFSFPAGVFPSPEMQQVAMSIHQQQQELWKMMLTSAAAQAVQSAGRQTDGQEQHCTQTSINNPKLPAYHLDNKYSVQDFNPRQDIASKENAKLSSYSMESKQDMEGLYKMQDVSSKEKRCSIQHNDRKTVSVQSESSKEELSAQDIQNILNKMSLNTGGVKLKPTASHFSSDNLNAGPSSEKEQKVELKALEEENWEHGIKLDSKALPPIRRVKAAPLIVHKGRHRIEKPSVSTDAEQFSDEKVEKILKKVSNMFTNEDSNQLKSEVITSKQAEALDSDDLKPLRKPTTRTRCRTIAARFNKNVSSLNTKTCLNEQSINPVLSQTSISSIHLNVASADSHKINGTLTNSSTLSAKSHSSSLGSNIPENTYVFGANSMSTNSSTLSEKTHSSSQGLNILGNHYVFSANSMSTNSSTLSDKPQSSSQGSKVLGSSYAFGANNMSNNSSQGSKVLGSTYAFSADNMSNNSSQGSKVLGSTYAFGADNMSNNSSQGSKVLGSTYAFGADNMSTNSSTLINKPHSSSQGPKVLGSAYVFGINSMSTNSNTISDKPRSSSQKSKVLESAYVFGAKSQCLQDVNSLSYSAQCITQKPSTITEEKNLQSHDHAQNINPNPTYGATEYAPKSYSSVCESMLTGNKSKRMTSQDIPDINSSSTSIKNQTADSKENRKDVEPTRVRKERKRDTPANLLRSALAQVKQGSVTSRHAKPSLLSLSDNCETTANTLLNNCNTTTKTLLNNCETTTKTSLNNCETTTKTSLNNCETTTKTSLNNCDTATKTPNTCSGNLKNVSPPECKMPQTSIKPLMGSVPRPRHPYIIQPMNYSPVSTRTPLFSWNHSNTSFPNQQAFGVEASVQHYSWNNFNARPVPFHQPHYSWNNFNARCFPAHQMQQPNLISNKRDAGISNASNLHINKQSATASRSNNLSSPVSATKNVRTPRSSNLNSPISASENVLKTQDPNTSQNETAASKAPTIESLDNLASSFKFLTVPDFKFSKAMPKLNG